jgi:hypothetical protein
MRQVQQRRQAGRQLWLLVLAHLVVAAVEHAGHLFMML